MLNMRISQDVFIIAVEDPPEHLPVYLVLPVHLPVLLVHPE